ncbi:MAG TPA: hypothetical protein VL981_00335 [Candidatus Methylacidiphilales bacterium]|nr:hypothetical protein [Candidatus Methylacidiphilales bacterium]
MTNALGSFGYGYLDETGLLASVTYPSGTGLKTNYSYYIIQVRTVFNDDSLIVNNTNAGFSLVGEERNGSELLAALRKAALAAAPPFLKKNGGCCDKVTINEYRNDIGPAANPPIVIQ